jgi:hypothetical protein
MALKLPTKKEWKKVIQFQPAKKGDTTGLCNLLGGATSIELISKGQAPVECFPVTMPLECSTVADVMSKGRGNLSFAIKMNPIIWESMHGIDIALDEHMIENADKLFSAKDAEFIRKDRTAIALKHPKPLVRYNADGSPNYNSLLRFRVAGRGYEVESFDVKDSPSGTYTSNVVYKEQVDSLPPNATRFCIVTGTAAGGAKSVATLLRRKGPLAAGEPKMRYVGPGDMRQGLIHSLKFSVSHFALVNGAASCCIRCREVIFENVEQSAMLPEGFVLANETEEPAEPTASLTRFVLPAPVAVSPEVARRDDADPPPAPKRAKLARSEPSAFSAVSKPEDPRRVLCQGCREDAPNQQAHMMPGGCLHEMSAEYADTPPTEDS